MDKRFLALIAGTLLIGSEVAHSSEFIPHSHVDLQDTRPATCTMESSASGGQVDHAGFYVQLAPVLGTDADGRQTILRYEVIATPDGLPESGDQQMKTSLGSMDALLASLGSNLKLPDVQLRAIRDGLSNGKRLEIGGYTGVRRIFGRPALRKMGLKISN